MHSSNKHHYIHSIKINESEALAQLTKEIVEQTKVNAIKETEICRNFRNKKNILLFVGIKFLNALYKEQSTLAVYS